MRRKDNVIPAGADCPKNAPQLDYLMELSGGDNNFIIEIIQMFISEAPAAVRQAVQHLAQNEWQPLLVTVHKLKSSVQVVGGQHLVLLINEIEQQVKTSQGESNVMAEKLSNLEKGIAEMVHGLNVVLPQFSIKDAA